MSQYRLRAPWSRSLFLIIGTAVWLALAADGASAEEQLHAKIDRMIAAGLPDYEERATPIASDEEFLRRVYLDLTGLIPTTAEARAFLADSDPEKRVKLIDRLLGSPEYVRHMQRVFDVILMRRLRAQKVPAEQWQTFLRTAFAENWGWDQTTREILSADGTDPENRGPARFYLDREGEVNAITRDVGRIFLGVDLECAQCHDHPEVDDWKQEHYYGLSAFLVRTFVFTDKQKKTAMLAEKAVGEVSFQSVFEPDAKAQSTPPRIFDGPALEEPEFDEDEAYKVKPAKNVRPIPKFSRLTQLPEAVINAPDHRFARAAANRLWALMMGRGLIHPVDSDHSWNPPSHPDLLETLTHEFEAHNFDIQWMLRELALSKTYQRSSRLPSGDEGAEVVPEEAFAAGLLKPLAPAQLAWAFLQATGEADVQRAALGDKLTEETLHKKLAGIETQFIRMFGGQPGNPPDDFESTIEQALFLSNDPTIMRLLAPKQGNLAHRLSELPPEDVEAFAEELFLSVLTRRPTAAEVDDVRAYLSGLHSQQRVVAIQELIWALMTSAEMRFNH